MISRYFRIDKSIHVILFLTLHFYVKTLTTESMVCPCHMFSIEKHNFDNFRIFLQKDTTLTIQAFSFFTFYSFFYISYFKIFYISTFLAVFDEKHDFDDFGMF